MISRSFARNWRTTACRFPGKTSQGISLYGNEFDIRRYVLENNFDQIYGTFPLDKEIDDLINDVYTRKRHLEAKAKANFRRFIILMLDRFLTGHYLGQISDKAYDLTARPEFKMVNEIVDQIGKFLAHWFPGGGKTIRSAARDRHADALGRPGYALHRA